jgi:hypothetical protein
MNISLPQQVELKCPSCKSYFTLCRQYLDERTVLYCPLCGVSFPPYTALTGRVRQGIYNAVRAFIEARVYEQQQIESESYFEDSPNL